LVECVGGSNCKCKGDEGWRFGVEGVVDNWLPFHEWWNKGEGDNIYIDS